MTTSEAQEATTSFGRSRFRWWLPLAGIPAVVMLAHLGGGALVHLGIGAVLAYLGFDVVAGRLGGGPALGVAAAVVLLALAVVCGRWRVRHGRFDHGQ